MEPDEIIYSEKQRFRQWWVWALILISPVGFGWVIFQEVALDSHVGDNSGGAWVLIVLWLIFGVGFPWFMYVTGLDTLATNVGVCIRFRPFHRNWIVFGFGQIEKAEALTYSPIKEYGGWGIRYGRKGKAYNVSGNKGVLLTFRDGKRTMIGSQNHEVLCSVITQRLSQDLQRFTRLPL